MGVLKIKTPTFSRRPRNLAQACFHTLVADERIVAPCTFVWHNVSRLLHISTPGQDRDPQSAVLVTRKPLDAWTRSRPPISGACRARTTSKTTLADAGRSSCLSPLDLLAPLASHLPATSSVAKCMTCRRPSHARRLQPSSGHSPAIYASTS